MLQALHEKYMQAGPYQKLASEIYTELRSNIVSNLVGEFEITGYAWEQYSCTDGKGTRSHPFTGFTALALLIMSEKY